jgi:O-antigen ligase
MPTETSTKSGIMKMIGIERACSEKVVFRSLWWLLWISGIVLLRWFFRDVEGHRINIPHGLEIYYGLTVLSVAILGLCTSRHAIKNIDKQFLISMLVLVLVLVCSATFGPVGGYSRNNLIAIFVTTLPFVLLGRMSVFSLDKYVMDPVLLLSFLCALSALLLSLYGPIQLFDLTVENYAYMSSSIVWAFLFQEANDLAWVMVAGITVLMFRFSMSRELRARFLLVVVMLPMMLYVFWMTSSRGSFAWLIIAILLYSGLLVKSRVKGKLIGGGINWWFLWAAVIAILIFLAGSIYWNEIKEHLLIGKGLDFTNKRMEVWFVVFNAFKIHPFLGYGFGATGELTKELYTKSPLNVFVGITGEAGLLGISALLYIWLGAIWKCLRVIRERHNEQGALFLYAFFLLVMLVGMAVQQNGEWGILFVTPFSFLFFFLVSAAWALDGHSHKKLRNQVY